MMALYTETLHTVPVESALHVSGLHKAYGATVALEKVEFSIKQGQVHALLGENGAGKSTLVKILSGAIRQDRGDMQLRGKSYQPESIVTARKKGVSTAFQELSLLSNLTVAQNLALPAQPKVGYFPIVNRKKAEERAKEVLEQFQLSDVDPRSTVASLSLANRQRVEIVRAMSFDPTLLVLDEPTAVQSSTDWIFEQIRLITARGTSILYVSHRLNEIRQLCKQGTVLRSGSSIATVALSDIDDAGIFELMVGRRYVARDHVMTSADKSKVPRLVVKGVSSGQIRDANFELHEGEILGVAGLDGQGQKNLFDALFGLSSKECGELFVDGIKQEIKSPSDAMKKGVNISLVPEERKVDGIFPYLTVRDNVVLAATNKIKVRGLISKEKQKYILSEVAKKVDLQERYFDFEINELSGGNQQKVLMARVLVSEAKTLLLFDPTRGVDVGTKEAIYETIQTFAANGGSVLLYSSELSELMRLCDRCLVIYSGKIVADLPKVDIDETHLLAAATGHVHQKRSAA